ncbi:hypothetical protein SAMN05216462_2161 [Xylanibacter ruminicola]|uniref:Uncharacterized protein n=1 Tax=Xylanibacter ruminicola TaxID=839 RepID=A0A1H4D6U3_XYLRU|nr:hypothetical protein [Xylanibacter ruminicola]SEA68465.1 hypothetical protein SAMN05216462_2161 [Xylanibacter ruminicola]
MQKQELKQHLIKRLKKENAFWSYDQKSIKDVPDDILVELVMLHLDLDDIDKIHGNPRVKQKTSFSQLNPVYDITPKEIEEYIKEKLLG